MYKQILNIITVVTFVSVQILISADEWWKPYSPPCTERENVFEFTEKPKIRKVTEDRYEITFAVKRYCDVAVAIIDPDPKKELVPGRGIVVRHLGAGVLGPNAPAPFQKNSLKQTIYWDGKDDLGFYHKEPKKLQLRVMLGLKPEFNKVLGWHPRNLIGIYRGIAINKNGVYVLSGTRPQLMKYDRNGNYVKTVFPPAVNIPIDRFRGLEKLEYEPGQWALHVYVGHAEAPDSLPSHTGFTSFASTVSGYGIYFPGGEISPQQVCLTGNGFFTYATVARRVEAVWLFRMRCEDGTSDEESISWKRLSRTIGDGLYTKDNKLITTGYFQSGEFAGSRLYMATSPDGKWLYLSGLVVGRGYAGIYRLDTSTREPLGKIPWLGTDGKPGHGNSEFASPAGIDCDSRGRIYICDTMNNRIQIYSPNGEYLKTIAIDSPYVVRVHPHTGALYVVHKTREQGRSVPVLSRLNGYDDTKCTVLFRIGERLELAEYSAFLMTLDPWTSPLRIWLCPSLTNLLILEEQGNKMKVLRDFSKEAEETGDVPHTAITNLRLPFPKISCDPVREKLYFENSHLFDLVTGKYEGRVSFPHFTDDIAFDKRGYVHAHLNPGFYIPGVARLDPSQSQIVQRDQQRRLVYKEIPYDYGVDKKDPWNRRWDGILPVMDQPGSKFFQDGFAVNMMGDIAVESNIYYVPRMEDTVRETFVNQTRGTWEGDKKSYETFLRNIQDMQKLGEEVYFVPRRPGIRLYGGTVWVYERSGELRKSNIAPGACIINGVGIDETGAIYFAYASPRLVNGRVFLAGRGRVIGNEKPTFHPFTGTVVKFPASGGEIYSKQAQIAMEPWPERKPDTAGSGWGWKSTTDNEWTSGKQGDWLEGAEWCYAGASPIVPIGCSCPNSRIYTDWYKRTFVPEAYRHSVGVIDTSGNLIMHIGRYGNADSGRGHDSPVKVGGDEIAMAHVQYISATDNFLCLSDTGNERIIVLKLGYHAEETARVE